jgi:hypothetical protein
MADTDALHRRTAAHLRLGHGAVIRDEQIRTLAALRKHSEECRRGVFPDRFKIARRALWGALALLAIYEWSQVYGTL